MAVPFAAWNEGKEKEEDSEASLHRDFSSLRPQRIKQRTVSLTATGLLLRANSPPLRGWVSRGIKVGTARVRAHDKISSSRRYTAGSRRLIIVVRPPVIEASVIIALFRPIRLEN